MPVQGDLIIVLAAIACGGFVLAAEPVTIVVLRRLAAIDAPSARSSHTVPTPRGGGAPIAIGLVLAAVVTWSTAMIAFSAWSPCSPPSARRRRGQPAGRAAAGDAGGASLAAGWVLGRLTGMPPVVALSAAILLTVWLVGYVNAFNFMDGVNGISARTRCSAAPRTPAWACGAPMSSCWPAARRWPLARLAFLPWNAVRARSSLATRAATPSAPRWGCWRGRRARRHSA